MCVPDDIRVGLAEAGLFLLLVLLGEEVVEVGHGGGGVGGGDEDGGLLGRAQEVKVDDGEDRHEYVVNRTDGRGQGPDFAHCTSSTHGRTSSS